MATESSGVLASIIGRLKFTALAEQTQQEAPQRTFLPAVPRIIAIGDLHGDLQKARRAFRLGGLIDENDRWIGGTTTAVQVGDQLDRGNDEIEILYFLERLEREAAAAGGALHVLNGNHETMNVAGRFTYATQPAMAEFLEWHALSRLDANLREKCGYPAPAFKARDLPTQHEHNMPALKNKKVAARWAALSPGGPITQRFLAPHPVVLQIGSTVFVHAGVLPEHARYGLERLNSDTREWMMGSKDTDMPRFLNGRDAVVWARDYSAEDPGRCDCDALQEALGMIQGANRMVVGHTIQRGGINSACEAKVHRIDVGLSAGCGNGAPQVLEILHDSQVRRLTERIEAAEKLSEHTGSGLLQPAPA